jgi:hypothetical protein
VRLKHNQLHLRSCIPGRIAGGEPGHDSELGRYIGLWVGFYQGLVSSAPRDRIVFMFQLIFSFVPFREKVSLRDWF